MINLTSKPEVAVKTPDEIPVRKNAQPDLFAQPLLETAKEEIKEVKTDPPAAVIPEKVIETVAEVKPPVVEIAEKPMKMEQPEKIEKIIVFYSNTFKEFNPK
jgi:hypothetical protein